MSRLASMDFPEGFIWGASTAAYQIEGGAAEGGRTSSIWDDFCRRPGAVLGGMNGDFACDSYRRWQEDVALLKGLGVSAYRFSLAWPRILPDGSGRPNAAGLEHYRRLCESLLEAGISPYACLYHWDLPSRHEAAGGWPARDTAYRFAEYAEACFEGLDGLVERWLTLNEPWCSAFLGYRDGEQAPGRREPESAYRAVHHLLLGHGLAVGAFRARPRRAPSGRPAAIGLAINPAKPRPATRRPEDLAASLRASEERTALFLDPLCGRGYPARLLADHPEARMPVEPGDFELIAAPIDFLGVNYYNEDCVADAPKGPGNPDGLRLLPTWQDRTEMGWDIVPEGLYRILRFIAEGWPVAELMVTENGAACPDRPDAAGRVRDKDRIAYLEGHLEACAAAIRDGVPLSGYLVWSLLDNFEWAHGYSKTFGLVSVDFRSGERRPKDSYYWYRDAVAGHVGFRTEAGAEPAASRQEAAEARRRPGLRP